MKQRTIIVGGGFAGLELVKHLDPAHYDILLLDRQNHHQFQPLFYQVASSQLEPSAISFPLRHIFRRKAGLQVRLCEVEAVDPVAREVITSIGRFPYDLLILAQGCRSHTFGKADIEQHTFPLKTTSDAIAIRNHILCTFERALSAQAEERKRLLHLVIVGAGPTGVELAGAFAEMKRDALPSDYPGIDFSECRITLVEGGSEPLAAMSEKARRYAAASLHEMDVELKTGIFVQSYNGQELVLSDGSTIETGTVIWAAGVSGNRIEGLGDNLWIGPNRLLVDAYNALEGMEGTYAVGDIACMVTTGYPKGHPMLANVAIQQARNLVRNLSRQRKGKERIAFSYRDMGSMATIGRNKAVVDLPFMRFTGFIAWVVWMSLHLMLILSVRNKLLIFIQWAWTYLTRTTSLRLILRPSRRE